MKIIIAPAFWTGLYCIVGLSLIMATDLSANAQPYHNGPIDEETLSIEAPVVQQILRRAAAIEGSSNRGSDQERAAQLYCRAARLGSLEAQYRLGKMMLAGRGMKQDTAGAATLLSIAAGNGHECASLLLAQIGLRKEVLPECLQDAEL